MGAQTRTLTQRWTCSGVPHISAPTWPGEASRPPQVPGAEYEWLVCTSSQPHSEAYSRSHKPQPESQSHSPWAQGCKSGSPTGPSPPTSTRGPGSLQEGGDSGHNRAQSLLCCLPPFWASASASEGTPPVKASVLEAPDDAHQEPDTGPSKHTRISTQGGQGGG